LFKLPFLLTYFQSAPFFTWRLYSYFYRGGGWGPPGLGPGPGPGCLGGASGPGPGGGGSSKAPGGGGGGQSGPVQHELRPQVANKLRKNKTIFFFTLLSFQFLTKMSGL